MNGTCVEATCNAGFGDCEVAPDLHEWNYGDVEGLTTAQIRARGPEWAHWTVWTGPVGNGETVDDVAARFGGLEAVPTPPPPVTELPVIADEVVVRWSYILVTPRAS